MPAGRRAAQQTMPGPDLDIEDTETSKRKPNIVLFAGVGAGIILMAVLAFMLLRGNGDTPPEPVASNDTAATATATPTPAADVGGLQIEVSPGDAKVLVDGKEIVGSGSPRLASNLSLGTHKIVVSAGDAYLPFEQDVSVAAGQPMSVPVKLRVRDVTVTATTEPAEATLKLVEDGNAPAVVGKGGDSFKVQRKPGAQYKLIAELAGHDPTEIPLMFTGGPNDSFKLVLIKSKGATPVPEVKDPKPEVKDPKPEVKDPKPAPKAKPKNAELKIGSGPGLPPATVWVDGQKQAKTTPVSVMVSAGSHTVKWKYPDGKTFTKKVTAAENSAQVIKGAN